MTPRPDARLRVLFAPEAPVAVVYRRGPAKWTQMWLWRTDTDEFTPGQWIKGYVHDDSTLSTDGRYVISRVMSGDQHTVLSRPPYFTALAVTVQSLCAGELYFLRDGSMSGVFQEYRAPQKLCPIRPASGTKSHRIDNRPIASSSDPVYGRDQLGRKIVIEAGKIGLVEGDNVRVLIDLNPYEPENIPPPDWALRW